MLCQPLYFCRLLSNLNPSQNLAHQCDNRTIFCNFLNFTDAKQKNGGKSINAMRCGIKVAPVFDLFRKEGAYLFLFSFSFLHFAVNVL